MAPERWQQVERIYHEAAARPLEERSSFLDQECAEDAGLRAEVERMLAVDRESGGFLNRPAFRGLAGLPALAEAFSPGCRLGPYEIICFLGAGGMGEVYKARDPRLNRTVAIKMLPAYVATDPDRRKRFLREARAASALNHSNIVAVHDIVSDGGRDALVMDYVDGETLDVKLRRKRLSAKEALGYAIQIADALAAAHSVGIVHRDIKPGNIMVAIDAAGTSAVKVLDFGLAKLDHAPGQTDSTDTVAARGTIAGTPAYMSPEQASGQPTDARTDSFSLGVVIYEMLTGRRPFVGESSLELLQAIIHGTPKPVPPEIPLALRMIVEKALEKDPADRYQTMRDMAVDLRRIARQGVPTASPSPPAKARFPFLPLLAISGLAAVVVAWEIGRRPSVLENPLANAVFTRLTNFEGAEHGAAISPDGKWVAFRADRDGPFDVWLTQVGTGRFLNLTQGKVDEEPYPYRSVGFSGDGSEIWLFGPPDRRFRLMPLMGGAARLFLAPGTLTAAWSPDGARVVYQTVADGDPMFVADRDGGSPRRIFIGPSSWHNHYQMWSQDGRWIYFVSYLGNANEMDLWRIAATGGTPERLSEHKTEVAYPAPLDNRTILYVARDRDGSGPWLWAIDVERKRTRRVSFGLEKYTSVASSADGRRLVATVANPTASLWTVPILDRPATEDDVKPFPTPSLHSVAPRFGTNSLFYLSSRGAGDGLWRYHDGQADEIWKGSDGMLLEPPAVSPDGQRIVIVLRRSGKPRLHMISADGAITEPIAPDFEVLGAACWSPDGEWIVTGASGAAGAGLYKFRIAGGPPVRLTTGRAAHPVWSPDGSVIAYHGPEVGGAAPLLAVTPDGVPVQLPSIQLSAWGERIRFVPKSKAIVYMERVRPWDFWLLDLTTKRTRRLTSLRNSAAMRTFDVTPDGRSIVFDRLRENSDVVLIELPK